MVIDDFGMRKMPQSAAEDLLEIIMRRYERASTLLTSNRPVEDWGKLLADVAAVGAMLAHGVVFQKASQALAWGGPRSFGHDGAAGAVGCVDPDTGVAFGYTIARGPWPGGADTAALAVARALGRL